MGKKSSPSGKKKTPDRVGKSVQQTDLTGDEVDGEVSEVKFLKFLEECMNDDVKTQRAVSSVRELVNIHQPILHVTLPKRIVSNNNADRIEWLLRASEIIFEQENTIPWAFSVKSTEKVDVKQLKARLAHAVQQQQQLSQESPAVQQQQKGRPSIGDLGAGQLHQQQKGRPSIGDLGAGQLHQLQKGRPSIGDLGAGQLHQQQKGRPSIGDLGAGQLQQQQKGRPSIGDLGAGQLQQQQKGRPSIGDLGAGQLQQQQKGRPSIGDLGAGQLHQQQKGRPSIGDLGAGQLLQQSVMGHLSQSGIVPIRDKLVKQPSQKGRLSQSDDEFMWDEPFGQPSQRSTALTREPNPEGGQQQQRRQVQPSQMGGLSQSDQLFNCDRPVSQPSQMGGLSQNDNVFNCDRPVSQPSQMGGLSQNDNVFICDSPVRQPSQRGGVSQRVNELICDKPVSQPAQTGRVSQIDKLLVDDKHVNQRSQMSGPSRYDLKAHCEQQQQRHVSGEKLQRDMQQTWADREVPSQMGFRSQIDNLRICDRPLGQPSQMSHDTMYEQKHEDAQQQRQQQQHVEREGHQKYYVQRDECAEPENNKVKSNHQVQWAGEVANGGVRDRQEAHSGSTGTEEKEGWQETMGRMMNVWQRASEKQMTMMQKYNEQQVLAMKKHDQFSGEDKAEFKYWFEDLRARLEDTCLSDEEKLRHLITCLKGNAKRQFREDNDRPTWLSALEYLSEKYGSRYGRDNKMADRFHSRVQKPGESVREFAFALKRLCPIDDYNPYFEQYMTGQLISGFQSARDREKATYEAEIKRTPFEAIVRGIEDYEYCRDKVSSRGSQAVKPSQLGAEREQRERGREQTRGGAVKYEHTQQQGVNQRQTYQPPANSSMRQAPYQVNTQQPPPGHSWNRQQDSNQQHRVNQVQWGGLRQPVQDYQQNQRLSGGRECFKCGEVGHLQSSCSNEDQGQMAGERPPQSFGHQAVRAVSVAKPVEDVEAVSAEVRALKDELAQLKHRDEFRYGMLSAKVHKMLMNDGIEKENESEKKEATVRAVSVPIQSFNAEAQHKEDYPIEVNGQPVGLKQVLFDTGAQMNLISQHFAAQLGVKIQPCKTPLVAVNMTTVVCAGVCTVELKIDEKMTVIECHVATESNTPLLVGTKAMQEQGIQLLSWTGRSLMASVIPAEGDVLEVRVPLVVAEKPEDKNGVISVSTEHDEEVKPATENVVESSETSNGELATGQDMNKWFSVPSEQYSQLKLILPNVQQLLVNKFSRGAKVSDPVIKLVHNRMEHGQMKMKPESQRDVKSFIVKTGHRLSQMHGRMKTAVSKVFVVSRKLVQKLF